MNALSFAGQFPEISFPIHDTSAPEAPAAPRATMVNISRAQSSDFTIVTAEGDKVTLSASRSAELSFSTYDSAGKTRGSKGLSEAKFSASREFSLAIEGDLNKEELKDIRRAIKTVMKSAGDVLKGDTEHAAERVSKLGKLDTLASIDADVQFRQEVSTLQVTAAPREGETAPPRETASAPTRTLSPPSELKPPANNETLASEPRTRHKLHGSHQETPDAAHRTHHKFPWAHRHDLRFDNLSALRQLIATSGSGHPRGPKVPS